MTREPLEIDRAYQVVHDQAMANPATRQAMILRPVAAAADGVAHARAEVDQAVEWLHEKIREAVAEGVPAAEVARVAGVSRQRVHQVAPAGKGSRARVHARKQAPASVRVNDPATVPTIPDTPDGLLSGVVSLRDRKRYGKPTGFMGSSSIELILETARLEGWGRVYLVGPPPFALDTGATQAEAVRAWALGVKPYVWEHWTAGEHYLADPLLPVLRFTHGATGQRVTIMRAAMWWGETDADVPTCERAWSGLERALDKVPAFAGAGLADTPATAGRALWLRTIPEGKSYPVMAAEVRELIASTSGQGRIQLLTDHNRRVHASARPAGQDFTYLDGRFMYAALTWGMPVGEPTRWTPADSMGAPSEAELRGRGRWRITATVPAGWDHVGLLGCPNPDRSGPWLYPDQAGQVFTTWADGAEVWLALTHGWGLVIHEGLTWREGKPLNVWRDALVEVWAEAAKYADANDSARLASRAVRSVLLYALGAFAARTHPVTRSAPNTPDAPVPDGAEVRIVADDLVWQEAGTLSAWSERTAHPEWSATVWARARVRLVTMALRMPRENVVAFATDALYVAGGPPGWLEDTGKPGEFRPKGHRGGPFTWPANRADLYRLRDESEA